MSTTLGAEEAPAGGEAPLPPAGGVGLVIGKFYPPHNGHIHLIDEAAKRSEKTCVIVMAADVESITGEAREAWLKEHYKNQPQVRIVLVSDNIEVDYESEEAWVGHTKLMQNAIIRWAKEEGLEPHEAKIDTVYASENYGSELARRLGANFAEVDTPRAAHPVSGTAIRADVKANWGYLPKEVKAGMALRVVILGAESSGTTTLSKDLTEALRREESAVGWVGEYGREYTIYALEALRAVNPEADMEDITWTPEDFTHIASVQNQNENEAAKEGGSILVCDTDALATSIWEERYLGKASEATLAEADKYPHALYVITSEKEVEFHQDGIRDGEHLRAWMNERFKEELARRGENYIVAKGTREERVEQVLDAIKEASKTWWKYNDPLG